MYTNLLINFLPTTMITKKLQTTIRKTLVLVLIYSIVFGTNLTLAQTQYAEPSGAPPGNNAPAPIHEGLTGQGKYWNNIPEYSLGSFLNIVEGLLSSWVIADGKGVAATQFCLGTEEEITASGFPNGNLGLNCVSPLTGWSGTGGGDGEGGSGIPNTAVSFDPATNTLSITDTQGTLSTNIPLGSGGGGGGSSLQPGQVNGNALVWNAEIQSWVSARGFKQVAFSGTNLFSFVMGDWPDALFSQIFGSVDPIAGATFGRFALNGPFFYRPDSSSDLNGDEGGTFGKILAGHATENYRVDWRTPGDLGLLTQADLGNINTLIQNLATLPSGNTTGQILYWWNNTWNLTEGVYITGSVMGISDGLFSIAQGGQFTFYDNENCPAGSDGSILNVEDISGLLVNLFNVKCNGAIRIGQFFADSEDDTVVLTNVPQLENADIIASSPRNLCYTTVEVDGVEKGLVVDCNARPTGQLIVNGPTPSNPNNNNNIGISDTTVELWPIPFGVDSVTVRACAGGGGGGGGSAGSPGSMDKAGGGGGGGGGAGECTEEVIPLTEPNLTHLRITVGRGGLAGNGGDRDCYPQGGPSQYNNQFGCVDVVAPNVGGPGGDGQNGINTKIEKMAGAQGNILISTPINLAGGPGGKGGRNQCAVNGAGMECGTFGGPGGKGGHVTLVSGNTIADLQTAQAFQNSNGEHGTEADINNAGTTTLNAFFFIAEYYSSFCNNTTSLGIISSCGGDGGDGQIALMGHPSSSNPYTGIYSALALTGQGGQGGYGCTLPTCDNHFPESYQGDQYDSDPYHATWGSGGGGGGGANGWMWVDYLAGTGYDYRSQGGVGRRGGPGFVQITW